MIQRLLFSVFLFLLASGLMAQSAARLNVELVGNLDYTEELSDVWGYVDSLGHEYAIVGVYDGVSIVSVSDSAPPVELQFIPGANTIWRDMKTYEHYGYVSNEGGNGLLIMDLSTLPGTVAYKDTIINNTQTIHNIYIDEKGRLYSVGTNNVNGGMTILDLAADPWRPTVMGTFNDTYVHDVYVRGGLAYAGEINDGVLDIIDVSDPANPVSIGSTTYPGAFTHNTWLNDAGDVVFTTDELSGAYIHAFDVSDPTDIKMLDRIQSPLGGGVTIPHNVHVLNDFLVISYYSDGIYIVDGSRPEALVEVGYYDTSPITGSGFNGSWGAYPFLPSGVILASDIEEGLFVLRPTYQRAAFVEGMVLDSVTGAMINGADVELVGTNEMTTTSATGDYIFGTASAGSYSIKVSKYGYITRTVPVTLVNGQVAVENILLEPIARVPFELIVQDAKTLLPIEGAVVEGVPFGVANEVVNFTTDIDGKFIDPNFVPNVYDFIVGKWGHRTIDTAVSVQGATNTITILLEQGYYDDFALDFGWQVTSTASTGAWERGEPIGTQVQQQQIAPDLDLPDDVSDKAYVTGNGGGNYFSDDIDNGTTELLSPPMDLSGYNEPLINFHYWLIHFTTQGGGGPGDDFLRVELSNGFASIPIFQYDNPFGNLWTLEDSFRIQDFLPLTTDIYVRFVVGDENNPNIVEAAIDGFEIIEGNPTVEPPLAVEDLLDRSALVVETNPVVDQLVLRYDLPEEWRKDLQFDLSSMQGAQLRSTAVQPGSGKLQIDFPFASGIYLGTLTHQGRVVAVRKIVKE